jgi:hypothetical protein
MITKTFDSWDTDDIERVFGLERVRHSPLFDAWMAATISIPATEKEILELLRDEVADSVDLWNEDELKFRCIAPLMNLIRYNTKKFRIFTQRSLTAIVQDIEISGRVDFVIATGKVKPLQPFFFLHEYKKEFAGDSDPRAQLVSEMLVARALNNADFPIYGCYVVGRNWFFVILDGLQYAESLAFDATQDDIFQIFAILHEAKRIITVLADQYA